MRAWQRDGLIVSPEVRVRVVSYLHAKYLHHTNIIVQHRPYMPIRRTDRLTTEILFPLGDPCFEFHRVCDKLVFE